MEEMVPTRKVLSFVGELEEMMNQCEGKEREVFRESSSACAKSLISVTE